MKIALNITALISIALAPICGASTVSNEHFTLKLDPQWSEKSRNGSEEVFSNKNNEKVRITYVVSNDPDNENILQRVMTKSGLQSGLEIKTPLKKPVPVNSNLWHIESMRRTTGSFLNQYGLINDDVVIFVAHTGKQTSETTKAGIEQSLLNICWKKLTKSCN